MTIPAWISSATEAVDAALSAASAGDRAASIQQVIEVLDGNDGEGRDENSPFAALTTAAETGLHDGWLESVPDTSETHAALSRIAEGDAAPTALRALSTNLPRFTEQLRIGVAAAWRTHVTNTVGGVEDLLSLSAVLAGIPGQRQASARLAKAQQEVARLSSWLPDAGAEARLQQTATLVEEAFEQAVGDDEVREFLIACSRSGAALGQLTKNVQAWINANQAIDRFSIQLGTQS